MIPFIDLKTQYEALKEPIAKRIQTVLNHGQFIMGPEVEECEKAMAKFVGCKHAITVSSGTDAAIIAMMAMGIGPGDEVITTPFSFIATAETIILVGATPVFVDIDPETYNIDPAKIEAAITSKTKAIQPVALYGQCADMNEINAIAKKHKLFVIEDGAQSFGAMYNGKRSCNLSDVGVTSFFPAKPLGCYGDGGAIFTNDDALAVAMKEIRVHGQPSRYHHTRIGVNGRLDTIQCAILIPKLERFSWELEQRDRIGQKFNQAFQSLEKKNVRIPKVKKGNTSAWAQYTLFVPDRDKFAAGLKEKGVPTSVHYPTTMAEQPAYVKLCKTHSIENATQCSRHVISLPMYPDMSDAIQDQIITAVLEFYKGA